MKTMKNFLFASTALVVLLACVVAAPANAQGPSGKFVLPTSAQWGGATLAPGEYSFTMDRPGGMLYLTHGGATVAMVMPQSVEWHDAGTSSLLLVKAESMNFIRELRLAESGVVLGYWRPKPAVRHYREEYSMLIPITH